MTSSILASPFKSVLNTNYAATEPEILQINGLLVKPLEELKWIDEDIVTIQETLRKITNKRNALAHAIDAHQALLSPIHRIPDDMLGEIFMACLPANFLKEAIIDINGFPALSTRICRRWRDVALSTPRLWTQVFVDIQNTANVPLRRREIQDQIRRSGVCPLDVFIRFPEGFGPHWEETDGPRYDRTTKLTEPILAVLHRWKRVRLEGAAQLTGVLAKLDPSKLTLLEDIELNLDGSIYSSLPANFLQAPNLKHLGLGRRLTTPTISATPWHRLTHLSFTVWGMPDSMPTQTLAETLALCQNLTSCFIRLYGWVYRAPDTIESDSYPLIRLPNLSTLKIYEGKPSNIHRSWDLPRLRDVEFHVTEIIAPHKSSASLRAIVERSEGSIQTMTTQIDMHNQGDLIGCLDRCADLRSLVLELPPPIHVGNQAGSGYTLSYPTEPEGLPHDDLLESLLPGHGPNNTTRCPRLENFRCDQKMVFSEKMFVEFITARRRAADRGVSKLRHILVNFGTEWKVTVMPKILRDLSIFIQEGLVIEFL